MATSADFSTIYSRALNDVSIVEQVIPLYTDQTGADNGNWINMTGVQRAVIFVNGITTGTFDLRAWNGATEPLATEHGEQLKAPLTGNGKWAVDAFEIPCFMKVYPSVVTSISSDVTMKIWTYVAKGTV